MDIVKITFFDVLFKKYKCRARHNTPALAVVVTDNINETLVALEQIPETLPLVEFSTSLVIELIGIFDEFSIYHWDDFKDKSKCFEYGESNTTR